MMNAPQPGPAARLRGNFVLLTADSLHLLLPQHEVGPAEYLEGPLEAGEEPGLLRLRGAASERRFAALSSQMTLLRQCPPGRFLVTSIGDGKAGPGWCWDEMKILIEVELQAQPIPAVLLAANAPIDRYVELDGKVAFPCSAQRLYSFALMHGD